MPATAREESRFEQAVRVYDLQIKKFARQHVYALPGTDAQDLANELLEVLWLCCNMYDPNKGAKFRTLFWTSAKNRFLTLHERASAQKRVGDYQRVWLDAESVQSALSEFFLDYSAEDEALAQMSVREEYRSRKASG